MDDPKFQNLMNFVDIPRMQALHAKLATMCHESELNVGNQLMALASTMIALNVQGGAPHDHLVGFLASLQGLHERVKKKWQEEQLLDESGPSA